VQNFMELSAAVHELSCIQRKDSDENNTVCGYHVAVKIDEVFFYCESIKFRIIDYY